jgi:hypothetical protein
LTTVLGWQEKFGYEPQDVVNLNALNDGFDFPVSEKGGSVLELLYPEVIWEEDQRFVEGLLDIATQHTRYQMAFGRRFLTLLVLRESTLKEKRTADFLAHKSGTAQIPYPFSRRF